MVPTLNQPVVDPTGRSNMRELFKEVNHKIARRNTINDVNYVKGELREGLTLTCEDRDGYYYSDDGINISYSGFGFYTLQIAGVKYIIPGLIITYVLRIVAALNAQWEID